MDGHEILSLIVSPDEAFGLFCCATHRPTVALAHAAPKCTIRCELDALASSAANGGHYFLVDVSSMLTQSNLVGKHRRSKFV